MREETPVRTPGDGAPAEPRRTPLHAQHLAAGARMVPFAGWEMPVQYAGLVEEHRAVRAAAGIFDVSHMGEVRIAGKGASAFLQHLTPNDVERLPVGRAQYSALLTPEGTYLDDLLCYHLGDGEWLLVTNASNADADFAWIAARAAEWPGDPVEVRDVGHEYALVAVQGPRAVDVLDPIVRADLADLRSYSFSQSDCGPFPALVSRTGYTGEDGFEVYVAPEHAAGLWEMLLDEGREEGLVPAGLGARDTLRLEAALALYGHELDGETTPWEAGLGWTVKLDKGDFIGRQALVAAREAGPRKKLIGFEVRGRGIAREGHPIFAAGGEAAIGRVTSGTWSPTFEKALGMAFVPPDRAVPGTALEVDVRGRRLPVEVVELPFYRRAKR
ncbi:MAG TPA: glycine cleavage system aminomethyltransferase GcvT [Thermoanaerobaculia bacterium]|nr:glycine cleavage system aminomethyltransferase GcvT [Thermoanaerobaculia bacterium]